jgi:integral membrane sensor domain MASE1
MGWSLGARAALATALCAAPGLLMGMMLPTGMRLVGAYHAELIPWAWGLNGAASVLGSVAAMTLAIHVGFARTFLVGGCMYLFAVVAGLRLRAT